MIKKSLTFLLAVFSLFAFSGCQFFGAAPQGRDRTIIQALGIDSADNGYRMSFQIFSQKGGGQGGIDSSKSNSAIIASEGETISEAIYNAEAKVGKMMFFGHNRLIVIGEEAAQNGVDEIIKYFSIDSLLRPDVCMVVSKGSRAEEIVSAPMEEGILPAEIIGKSVNESFSQGKTPRIKFTNIHANMWKQKKDMIMPVVEKGYDDDEAISNSKEEQEKSENPENTNEEDGNSILKFIKVEGTSIFKDNKLIGYLDDDESRGLAFLYNTVKDTCITVNTENLKALSLTVYASDVKINMEINNNIDYNIKIKASAKLEGSNSNNMISFEQSFIDEAKNALKKEIIRLCDKAISKAVLEYQANVLNYKNLRVMDGKDKFVYMTENWGDYIPKSNFNYDIEIKLDRIGLDVEKNP